MIWQNCYKCFRACLKFLTRSFKPILIFLLLSHNRLYIPVKQNPQHTHQYQMSHIE